ncbi:MAG: hypothetical protein ACI8Y4_003854 [Candidatus Poriferisodalaceae bacterium]|jgi:hypothetical protein
MNVEQNHVRLVRLDHVDRSVDIVGFSHHLNVSFQRSSNPGSHERVIVDEDDAQLGWWCRGLGHDGSFGRRSSTSVPSPGVEVMSAEPP